MRNVVDWKGDETTVEDDTTDSSDTSDSGDSIDTSDGESDRCKPSKDIFVNVWASTQKDSKTKKDKTKKANMVFELVLG